MTQTLPLLPKVELHVHLEGTIGVATARKLAVKNNLPFPETILNENGHYKGGNLPDFLVSYDTVAGFIRQPSDYTDILYAYLIDVAAQGCVYEEIMVAPDFAADNGVSYVDFMDALALAIDKARAETGIEARLNIASLRHHGAQKTYELAKTVIANPHPYVVGFGNGGNEMMHHFRDFKLAFDLIRNETNLGIHVHAGEACGAQSVWDALDYINPARIGHGVRSVEDERLMDELAERRIVLEICPSSNIELGVYPSYDAHPFNVLVDAGIPVTVNSDDPPFFHTTLAHEYKIVQDKFRRTQSDCLHYTKTAIRHAFCGDTLKEQLLKRVGEYAETLQSE